MQGDLITRGGTREKVQISWDTDKPDTVAQARQEFDTLVKTERFMPTDGKEQLPREFDETQPHYELVAPLAGG